MQQRTPQPPWQFRGWGTEPGILFYSEDNGSISNWWKAQGTTPSRPDENQWFGAGRDYPFIHSIVADPRDEDHVYIAGAAPAYSETRDGGKSYASCKQWHWSPPTQPNPDVEVHARSHLVPGLAMPTPTCRGNKTTAASSRTADGTELGTM